MSLTYSPATEENYLTKNFDLNRTSDLYELIVMVSWIHIILKNFNNVTQMYTTLNSRIQVLKFMT